MFPSSIRHCAPAGMLLATLLAGGCGSSVLEPVEMRVSVVEGDRQVDSVTAVLPTPLRVQVQDQHDRPLPGVEIRWRGYPEGGTLSSATSLTDAQGIAAVTYRLGVRVGAHYVSATAAGISGELAWFEFTAEPGAPVRIQQRFGGDALGLPGATMSHYGVFVTDDHGNPVPGVTVDWLVSEGDGTVHPVQSTSASSHPTTTRHTLGPPEGRHTVLAVASDLPGAPQVAFTATAVTAVVKFVSYHPSDCYTYYPCDPEFLPYLVTISPGQSVGWILSGPVPCPIVFGDDPPPGSSTTNNPSPRTRIFTVPGLYHYRCGNPAMELPGAVLVQ